MNFNYPLRTIFKRDITKITNHLLPDDFTSADKRAYRVASDVVINILDEMGIASAKAQDLQKPITSWDKLKNSDHTVYVLVDREEDVGGNGYVLGFLKMGKKNLYIFDLDGKCHERTTLCVLDFYVHESVQRTGLGKKLFEYMLDDGGHSDSTQEPSLCQNTFHFPPHHINTDQLTSVFPRRPDDDVFTSIAPASSTRPASDDGFLLKEEQISPDKLAIDRPSHKFLLFLQKHYGLDEVVSQSNNFAVFTGFFDKAVDHDFMTKIPTNTANHHLQTSSLSTSHYNTGSNRNDYQNSGRHTAYKSKDTIGQIIQSYQA